MRGRDSARHKYTERRRASAGRGYAHFAWWAILEGPTVIGITEAPSLASAEQLAAYKFPDRQIVTRLWSALTVMQRAAARAALPECRLIVEGGRG